jgi:transposase
MSQSRTLSVGMDGHTESIAVASVAQEHGAEVVSLGTLGTRQCDSDTLLRPLQSQGPPLVLVDDAGPCGDWLSRSLTHQGDVCWGVAPSLIPTKPGDRGNTDRRDARPLARLRRSGDRTPVSVPAVDDAAMRDLSRAREDTLRELQAAQLRLQAFVLRHAIRSPGRANGRLAHLRWLHEVGCPTPAQHMVLQEDVQTVTAQTARLSRLEHALHTQGHTWRFQPVGEALQALRDVQCTVAVTTVAARGDLTRCDNPRQRMHSLGLTPSEYARGTRRQQGRMTQTGHTHAHRALVEGAGAYRYPAQGSRPLQRRLETLPTALQALRWQAHVRLCKRYRQWRAKGKNAQQVIVAMARACRAFIGAMAQQGVVPPQAYSWRRVDPEAFEISHRSRQRRSPGVVSPAAA